MGQSPDGESLNYQEGEEFHQGKIHFTDKYIKESTIFTTAPTKIAEANSILVCVRAPVGVVNITKRKICIGRGLCAIQATQGLIDGNYLYYFLKSQKEYFENNSTGSTFKAINGDILRNLIVPIPPLNEQKRIVRKVEAIYSILENIEASLQS